MLKRLCNILYRASKKVLLTNQKPFPPLINLRRKSYQNRKTIRNSILDLRQSSKERLMALSYV